MSRKRYKWLKNDSLTSTAVAVMNSENKRKIKKSGNESRRDWATRGSEKWENRTVWWMCKDMGFCQWVMRWNGVLWSLLDCFCWSFLVLLADWWFIQVVRRRKDVVGAGLNSTLGCPPAAFSLTVFLSASFTFAPSVHSFLSLVLSSLFYHILLPTPCFTLFPHYQQIRNENGWRNSLNKGKNLMSSKLTVSLSLSKQKTFPFADH